jgi:glycosyltransferase involved in cell wall biosynthesis
MKIAILGTRGIPNHYGGFEQYAELLSVYLVAQGWDVTVYNSHNHPYQRPEYKGVKIKHIYNPEKKMGTIGQFFYDLGCIWDTRKQDFDIVYQLGYTSSAVFNFLFKKNIILVTNMDGMEWNRSKYNKYVQRFLMYSERIAVKHSDFLIADSLGIKAYLDEKYQTESFYSAYTADIPEMFTANDLQNYGLEPYQYHLVIARLEPENNIDTILEAHTLQDISIPVIVIGNHKTVYGSFLKNKFEKYVHIKFIGAIYDKKVLDSIRHFSKRYFHGHSVGGTNPSLLEAMACSCNIIAHDNIFNKSVLENEALFFSNAQHLSDVISNGQEQQHFFEKASFVNLEKIKTFFSEEHIFSELKNFFILFKNRNVERR